jgi:SH3-like domain-containing protein
MQKKMIKFTIQKIFLVILCLMNIAPEIALAQKAKQDIRFVTTKSDNINARKGPGISYPIEWVLVRKSKPLKITAEFEQWRRVEDSKGLLGWVHSSVLSPKRSIIYIGSNIGILFKKPTKNSRIAAKLEPGLRCQFDKVENNWSKIKCNGYKGWIESKYVWGLSEAEMKNE